MEEVLEEVRDEEQLHKEKKKSRRPAFRSTIGRMIAIIVVMMLPLNIVTILLITSITARMQTEVDEESQNTLDVALESMTDDLQSAARQMLYLRVDNTEFQQLASGAGKLSSKEVEFLQNDLQDEFDSAVNPYEDVSMMYAWFPELGRYVFSEYRGEHHSSEFTETISYLYQGREKQYGSSWYMIDVDEDIFLLSFTEWNGAVFGVIVDLEQAMKNMNLPSEAENRIFLLANNKETLFSENGQEFLLTGQTTLDQIRQDRQYLVYEKAMEEMDLQLVEIVPRQDVFGYLPKAMLALEILAAVLTILAIPVLLLTIRKLVAKPLIRLTQAMDRIEEGDLDYRINETDSSIEFEQINQNFNHMMEEVQKLTVDVYEEQLERKDIQMRYLSQQIQPHFILNALNILYSYEPEEYKQSQRMILCISKYFRYIVKVRAEFVPLYQEMDHLKNYFEIQKARFPELFFSLVEYDETLKEALIPPLIVQNLAENSIKNSLKIGNKISIIIVAERAKDEKGRECMRIRLADTGEGMPDEIIAEIEKFKATGEPQQHLGVGIQNTIERLKLLYSDWNSDRYDIHKPHQDATEPSIRFWRDEHYRGTNIEIILPICFATQGDKEIEGIIG